MRKVLVIDTSVLCVWLKVPGKETCGPSKALVTYEMVSEKIEEEKKKGTTFILPLQPHFGLYDREDEGTHYILQGQCHLCCD